MTALRGLFCCASCPHNERTSKALSFHRDRCEVYKRTNKAHLALSSSPLPKKRRLDVLFPPQEPSGFKSRLKLACEINQPLKKQKIVQEPFYQDGDFVHAEELEPNHLINNFVDEAEPAAPPPPQELVQPEVPLPLPGRPSRNHRYPLRTNKALPEAPPPLSSPSTTPESIPPTPAPSFVRRVILHVRDGVKTCSNAFGLWRDYPDRPSHDPDRCLDIEDLTNQRPLPLPLPQTSHFDGASQEDDSILPSFWPFVNKTVMLLMEWFHNGATSKTADDVNQLIKIIQDPEFIPAELDGFTIQQGNLKLDKAMDSNEPDTAAMAGFTTSDVTITVPSGSSDLAPKDFSVSGLLHRNLTSVVKEAFQDPIAANYHLSPFKLYSGKPNSSNPPEHEHERLYGEIYTSDAFYAEHYDVKRNSPPPLDNPDCKLEKVVAALMFASDATMLTSFGEAKAWPIYLMLGNLSKYIRAQVNAGAMHHLAYIPSLPKDVENLISQFHPKWKTQSQSLLTHCRRELLQAIWDKLLDDEFLLAFKYGVVVKCFDGVERRIYPRIFTYSADYPEKVLLATIRDKGLQPCPRCHVSKEHLDKLGLPRDANLRTKLRRVMVSAVEKARILIYRIKKPWSVSSTVVEAHLKVFSGVPTENTFVKKLGNADLPAKMLVNDFLHEVELGVWKALFTHLVRILYAADNGSDGLIQELNERYRAIQPFGRSTIRRFSAQVSEMKRLAARDFEDLLQVSAPAFEGLLPPSHNARLMKLLYRLSEWHALAKLRMHSETTLKELDIVTKSFGHLARQFRDSTCTEYATMETPKEAAARARRQAAQATASAPEGSGKKPRSWNLFTPKFHFFGDYVSTIRQYGTTDSYSTQLGELAHRTIKSRYRLTNKKNALAQIGKQIMRSKYLHGARRAEDRARQREEAEADYAWKETPGIEFFISRSRKRPLDIYRFVQQGSGDPAFKNFIPRLKDHCLGRVLGLEFDGEAYSSKITDAERNNLIIVDNTIFEVATARIYYTSYDVRRDFDSVSPSRSPFVMVRSSDETCPHPFWYAMVIGVFHMTVQHIGGGSRDFRKKHVEFLWVRWLGVDTQHRDGRERGRMPKIGFVPEGDEFAFGFLDPSLVLRGAHLIPCFLEGRTDVLLKGEGRGRVNDGQDRKSDWRTYYVSIFADRDLSMQHLGGGVGHLHRMQIKPLPLPTTGQEQMECDPDPEESSSECGDDVGDQGDSDVEELTGCMDPNVGESDDDDMEYNYLEHMEGMDEEEDEEEALQYDDEEYDEGQDNL